ncbi:hypothetical protein GOP47_0011244 [Adiantum capillus-veneris]|uniref:4-coumarate--CoA ligase n=1 Tax=Adiantum capillus-veneris TaxID=13818 RepID=A0A9D4USX1_ADICA|nr:hypothetical protein GOP47_0011244 [Adiantum capillus-veneris]
MGEEIITLTGLLQRRCAECPDNLALLSSGGPELTYAYLDAAVNEGATQLLRAGIKPGDVVALSFPNSIEFVLTFLAVIRARAVAAPLNSAYTEDEFKFYLEDSQSVLLIVPAIEGNKAAESAAKKLDLPIAEGKWNVNNNGVDFLAKSKYAIIYETMDIAGIVNENDDEALFLHTSGTTSRPKGVPLTQLNLSASVQHIVQAYELGPGDKTVIILPLFHVHGLMAGLLSSLIAGGTVVLPSSGRFSATKFWDDMKMHGATWYTAVPTVHQILLEKHKAKPELSYPDLRFIRSCSASLAPAVLQQLEEAFRAPVLEAYAMTEASHQMTSNPIPQHGPHKPGCVGKPTGIKLAILDDEGRELPPGQVGEVCIKGLNVTKGYKNNADANKVAFAFGWFHTGDRGFLDEDGYLSLTGRIKELINRGGEKISPLEVDAVLLAHPAVAQAVTFAAPDSKYGEEVNAAIVFSEGAFVTEEEIKEFCKKNLATFKIPKKIFFAKDVPRTPTGKIQRRIVAEHFLSNKSS